MYVYMYVYKCMYISMCVYMHVCLVANNCKACGVSIDDKKPIVFEIMSSDAVVLRCFQTHWNTQFASIDCVCGLRIPTDKCVLAESGSSRKADFMVTRFAFNYRPKMRVRSLWYIIRDKQVLSFAEEPSL